MVPAGEYGGDAVYMSKPVAAARRTRDRPSLSPPAPTLREVS